VISGEGMKERSLFGALVQNATPRTAKRNGFSFVVRNGNRHPNERPAVVLPPLPCAHRPAATKIGKAMREAPITYGEKPRRSGTIRAMKTPMKPRRRSQSSMWPDAGQPHDR
jgi:hypothetical protein